MWGGKPQHMNYAIGIPKGLRAVLEEQGVNTTGMNGDEMRAILGSHPDFQNEKSGLSQKIKTHSLLSTKVSS